MQVPHFVLAHTSIKDTKMWHFYVVLAGWATIYTTMNVSVVLFLNEILDSIFLSGLALSVGSAFAMLFDGYFSSLQKSQSARKLLIISIIGMMISVLFFVLSSGIFLAFVAAIFFRISFDLCDITAVSYVLAKSTPDQYGQNLSYKQLSQGVGMIMGLLVSAILLAAAYLVGDAAGAVLDENFVSALFIMKVFLLVLLACLLLFTLILFDREVGAIGKKEIMSSIHLIKEGALSSIKKSKTEVRIESTDMKEKKTEKKEGIFEELASGGKDFFLIFQKLPRDTSLIWSMGIMGLFSYWDTFLATFLPIFFTEVLQAQEGWISKIPGSLLLLVFILPILGFLPMAAKLGDKIGRHYLMIAGVAITAIATFIAGFVSIKAFWVLIAAGFGISFGYLFGMSSAKAQTATKLNAFMAFAKKSKKIDSNASAGPIMIVDNLGNIIGPVIGGLMIDMMGFQGFFLFFAFFLLLLLGYTAKNYKKISE